MKGDEPFIATYEPIKPHHQYLAPTHYVRENFVADEVPPEELKALREELLEWRAHADAAYPLP